MNKMPISTDTPWPSGILAHRGHPDTVRYKNGRIRNGLLDVVVVDSVMWNAYLSRLAAATRWATFVLGKKV